MLPFEGQLMSSYKCPECGRDVPEDRRTAHEKAHVQLAKEKSAIPQPDKGESQ